MFMHTVNENANVNSIVVVVAMCCVKLRFYLSDPILWVFLFSISNAVNLEISPFKNSTSFLPRTLEEY